MKVTGRIHDDLKRFSRKHRIPKQRKTSRTWIMVADHHVAKIFEKSNNDILLIDEAYPDAVTMEMDNKSIGRVVSSSSGSIHHKYEPHMNPSRQEALAFIDQISAWLDKAVWEDAFDRLVLIAPPQALGELRHSMKQPVHARIIAEINKDLTKFSERELKEELEKIIWF